MNKQKMLIISSIMGFLGVAIGAFGAHGLKNILSPEMTSIFKTGVEYHLIHAVVLFAIALSGIHEFVKSFYFILAGIILFSFSLYCYSTTGILFFAMITPVGGISFLIGWLLIGVSAFRKKDI